ncbi:transposase [Streptomyces sp. NPDC002514]|uniref:transposase n=1 Tax=unclassified Streptomyces TaxID=2593676 RepID=UPI0036B846C5
MREGEIPDAEWAVIEPLLPPMGRAWGRWRDHRQVLESIVFKFRTSVPWRRA